MPEPFGGEAVYDVAVSAAAAVHRDLTAGMAVCPTELAQVSCGRARTSTTRPWTGGDVVTVHRKGKLTVISPEEFRLLSKCDYQERKRL
jgi:hypothetical protein